MDIVLYFVAVAILIVLIVSAVKVRGKTEEGTVESTLLALIARSCSMAMKLIIVFLLFW